jgi:hypothetical protein
VTANKENDTMTTLAIGELVHDYPNDDRTIWHLRAGVALTEASFQPVKCGGGIVMPGTPIKVADSDVCPDCRAGRITL